MFGDMLGKLQEMQQKMQESKDRLSEIRVTGEAASSAVKVTMDGNRKMISIEIEPYMCLPERKEELEDFIVVATNRALEQAEKKWEEEMKGSAGNLLSKLGM